MSGDDIKHQMDFILKQQAIFSSDMIELKNRLDQLTVGHQEQREIVQRQSENIDKLAVIVQHLVAEAEANRQEMRGAIENLIIGNEATRELASKAAQLAIGVSHRLTAHEREPHN